MLTANLKDFLFNFMLIPPEFLPVSTGAAQDKVLFVQ